MLPKARVPREFSRGLFNPEFVPKSVNLNDVLQEGIAITKTEEAKEKVAAKISKPVISATPPSVPIPLSEAEAEEADRQILNTQMRIAATKKKIELARTALDEAINNVLGGKELSFKIDIKKKQRVQRALKKLYGEKLDTISYSMYKEMVRAKAELEKQEVADYARGKTKDKSEKSKD